MIKIKNGVLYFKPKTKNVDEDTDFTIKIYLGKKYRDIKKNPEFVKSLDKLLNHLYSTLPLWKHQNRFKSEVIHIENCRLDLYEETMETLLYALGEEQDLDWEFLPDDTIDLSSPDNNIHMN